uniref:Uncharacterized protein n=1 Tax=viral metagenome TaxID=1070528 RepID=A0A6M3K1S4_9ZZZZ
MINLAEGESGATWEDRERPMAENNGWDQHKRDVLRRLDDNGADIKEIKRDLGRLFARVERLGVKVGGLVMAGIIVGTAAATAIAKWLTP